MSNIISLGTLKSRYRIDETNFLHYLRVKGLCKQFLKNNSYVSSNLSRPNGPNHIKILYRTNKGERDLYKYAFTNRKNTHSMKEKCNSDLTVSIDNRPWKSIFNTCYFTTHDNCVIWFQLRIIYRILGTGHYLYKIGIIPTMSEMYK